MTQPANKRLVTEAALTTYAAAKWQPIRAYSANDLVLAPDGTIIQRNANGTSRASYDATEQALWTVKSSGGAVASVNSKTGAVTLSASDVGADAAGAATAAQSAATSAAATDATTKVANAVAAHLAATDPHGDRAYTTAQITAALNSLINSAPGTLDTLGEIAAQLATDESAVGALTTAVNARLATANNLSDVPDKAAARTNLGLGTAATQPATAFEAAGAVAAEATRATAAEAALRTGTDAVLETRLPVVGPDIVRSVAYVVPTAANADFNFPARARGWDKHRRRCIVRNVGTASFVIGYGSNDSSDFNNPGAGQFIAAQTVPVGSEWVDTSERPIFFRPVSADTDLVARVETELGVI